MKYLIFGANGSIGRAVQNELIQDHEVYGVSHSENNSSNIVFESPSYFSLVENNKFDGVVWASGANINDSILELDLSKFNLILEANLIYLTKTLSSLLQTDSFSEETSLVVISSIWQNLGRNNKFSYSVSKSAISGFVKSTAIDLGRKGIRINSVSPGVVLNEMTKSNLTADQISSISNETPLGKLVKEDEVSRLISWLLSTNSRGITGQNITIDGGWSVSRYV